MNKGWFSIIFILALACPAAFAQQAKSVTTPAKSVAPADIADVIRRFAAAESENKIARNNYTFVQDFDLLTLGAADSVTGRFKRVSEIVYDDLGNRIEKITFFPQPTLTELQITPEDMRDLAGVQPFALTTEDLQVVKVQGQAVPEINNQKFPHFESYRENIDGRYWFPTYIYADDVLDFKKGPSVHLRMTVRFTNYKRFAGRIRVLDDGEVNN